jgi:hypothetical protein
MRLTLRDIGPLIIKSVFWENTRLHAQYVWTLYQALIVSEFCTYILDRHSEMTTN